MIFKIVIFKTSEDVLIQMGHMSIDISLVPKQSCPDIRFAIGIENCKVGMFRKCFFIHDFNRWMNPISQQIPSYFEETVGMSCKLRRDIWLG